MRLRRDHARQNLQSKRDRDRPSAHCKPMSRANACPMTGFAKQSGNPEFDHGDNMGCRPEGIALYFIV
jgi:hypothetical protein